MTVLDRAHALDAASVAHALETDLERGLTTHRAAERLASVGPNVLREEPPEPRWRRFARQFADPLVILLLAAAAIAAGVWLLEGMLGFPIDSIVILAIVLLNAALGDVQEARAERAIAALRALTEVTATVVRGGWVGTVPAREDVSEPIALFGLVEDLCSQHASRSLSGARTEDPGREGPCMTTRRAPSSEDR